MSAAQPPITVSRGTDDGVLSFQYTENNFVRSLETQGNSEDFVPFYRHAPSARCNTRAVMTRLGAV